MRWLIYVLFGSLASPIDLIPDFLPVIGYADDAIIVALVLRAVVKRTGPEALVRPWPGTPDGLAALAMLARVNLSPLSQRQSTSTRGLISYRNGTRDVLPGDARAGIGTLACCGEAPRPRLRQPQTQPAGGRASRSRR